MIKAMNLLLAFAGFATLALPQAAQAQDVAAGQKKAAMCIGCHGIPLYQASFPQVHKVPMIAGQTGKYIAASLNAYKKGDRKHPTMRSIAASLTDADIADLSAFYEAQAPKVTLPEAPAAPSPAVAALLAKGACASCHGANFSKPIDAAYPKLAGQHADFLFVALKSYGTEGSAQVGRANAIMGGQVKQFKNAELKQIADYLGSLPGEVATVPESRFR